MTNPNPGSPLWPTDFQGCTVTAQYLNLSGLPMTGTVSFIMSPDAVMDQTYDIIIVPRVTTAALDVNGSLSVVLPATDDPDINPTNWTYAVSENFAGGRKYNIQAPQNTTIDLSQVAPIPDSKGQGIIRGPRGPAGGIQMVNGHVGDIVTISYADVGADQAGAAAGVSAASLQRATNLNDVSSKTSARANLGLGNASVQDVSFFNFLVPIGTIMMWGGSAAPTDYLICNGAQISRSTYAGLFAVLGTSYGVGNGTTTFTIPDFTARFPAQGTPGDAGGTATHGHTGGAHKHALSDSAWAQMAISDANGQLYYRHTGGVFTATRVVNLTDPVFTTANAGASVPLDGLTDFAGVAVDPANNLPPYLGVSFILRAL